MIPSTGNISVVGNQVLPSGDYNFGTMELRTGSSLVIRGPARVVIDDMAMRSNSDLILDTASGKIEFFVSGAFKQASNSTLTTTSQSAGDMTLNFVGDSTQTAFLHSNSQFYGVIYAPEATVDIASNFEIYGAVVADSILLAANCRVHYDEALRAGLPGPEIFELAGWSTAGFPDARLAANRFAPFALLGLDPLVLDLPAEGHELPAP